MVDAALPVVDIQGLSDFSRPHPKFAKKNVANTKPKNGSAHIDGSGCYFGNDFSCCLCAEYCVDRRRSKLSEYLRLMAFTPTISSLMRRRREMDGQTLSSRLFYWMASKACRQPVPTAAIPKFHSTSKWPCPWRRDFPKSSFSREIQIITSPTTF